METNEQIACNNWEKIGIIKGRKQAQEDEEIKFLESLITGENCYCSDYNPKCHICKIQERITKLKEELK